MNRKSPNLIAVLILQLMLVDTGQPRTQAGQGQDGTMVKKAEEKAKSHLGTALSVHQ